ncbi:hypothetical protein GTP46_19780 [Duganella sp. FT135W]|uniref:Uncharacterized protein n=1 Tax=Duganella flavida TaxID=2692175 RepID=A0A6L8KGA9_9BURK|nr:hypothetical protein [Duganella flavida]MYM24874.1 hypothetical protein [Duganella flavida]
MKAKLLAASLLALSASAFASDVGVSISVGQPGFYGRLDIGDYPAPQLLYRQPVIIERPVRYVETAPIYLRVPPGHAKNWGKHCYAYHACGQRVYFVQDGWYNREYVPRYRERHGGPERHDYREVRREERRDFRDDHRDDHRDRRNNRDDHDDHRDGRYDDRGPGHDNGHGRGHERRD